MKVYREPKRPHSYLECRVRDDRDLYPRPHITHRYRSSPPSPVETRSVARLAASIQGGLFTSYGFLSKAHETSPIREISLEYLLLTSKPQNTHFRRNTAAWAFLSILFIYFSFFFIDEEKARTKRVDDTESSSLQRKTVQKAA